MIEKPVLYKFFAAILVVALLSGCNVISGGLAPTATPTTTSTTAPTATVALPTATQAPSASQTVAETQAAPTGTSSTASAASAATSTTVPLASTSTPAPTLTAAPPTPRPNATFLPYILTPSATPTGYACLVTSTSPASTESVKVSTNFNWSWVIKNTGVKFWGHANADLKYFSGTTMQTGGSLFDLTADVPPGASYSATIAMLAPSTAGTYTAIWEIIQDSVLVCTLNVSVRVTS